MRKLLLLLVVAASPLALGCAVDSGQEDDIEEVSGETEGALTAKAHFAPAEVELDWRPGCGMRIPDGRTCYMGLELTFTKSYRDLKVSTRTTVSNSKKTITVKLDTWSTESVHMMAPTQPETKELGHPRGLNMSTTYAARVVDWQGNELWSGEIRPMPAP